MGEMDLAPTIRHKAALDLAITLCCFAGVYFLLPWLSLLLLHLPGKWPSLAPAACQFLIEGAAPLALMAFRGEHFSEYGFTSRRLGSSLAMGLALAALYDIGYSCYSGFPRWIPFGAHRALHTMLQTGFPVSLVGLVITLLTWGFLEGFFGIYFSRKVNQTLGHDGRGWGAPGVLAFALFNGAIHMMLGQGMEGFVSSFASGYAITVIPALTENAWGGTLVQTLTDAIGGWR